MSIRKFKMVFKHYCDAHLKEGVKGKHGMQENANLSTVSPKLKTGLNCIKPVTLHFPLYQNTVISSLSVSLKIHNQNISSHMCWPRENITRPQAFWS